MKSYNEGRGDVESSGPDVTQYESAAVRTRVARRLSGEYSLPVGALRVFHTKRPSPTQLSDIIDMTYAHVGTRMAPLG